MLYRQAKSEFRIRRSCLLNTPLEAVSKGPNSVSDHFVSWGHTPGRGRMHGVDEKLIKPYLEVVSVLKKHMAKGGRN
jgi:hypothetical protein